MRWLWLPLGAGLLALVAWLVFRDTLLDQIWSAAAAKAKDKGYLLSCKERGFSGLMEVRIVGLTLTWATGSGAPAPPPRLLYIKELQAKPDLYSWLLGKPGLSKFHASGIRIQAFRLAGCNNIEGLLPSPKAHPNEVTSKKDRIQTTDPELRWYRPIRQILDRIPSDLLVQDLDGIYRTDSMNLRVQVARFSANGPRYQTTFTLNEKGWSSGTQMQVQRATLALDQWRMRGGNLEFEVQGQAPVFHAVHPRLSVDPVRVQNASGILKGRIGPDFVELDSSSTLRLHRLQSRFYARWTQGTSPAMDLRWSTAWTPSTDFLASLPRGIFRGVQGMRAKGSLRFVFSLQLEDKSPEACRFYSKLEDRGFRITQMGAVDLAKMSRPFEHLIHLNDRPVRTRILGPSDPYFAPLSQIPFTVQQAIMTGEDGDFYHHRGFYAEAFRRSIALNYRKGRFARGGSTLTMQLVKNVFLSPRKTIARKAEELLLTWIIEHQKLTSKARMMEVYLNVIEFGNNIWGIREATRYYFGKEPSELTPIESVFLAGLVPRPRVLQYLVEANGDVSTRNGHFVAIRDRFVRRGWLPPEDSNRVRVGLRMEAYRHRLPVDSTELQDLGEEDELD